MNLQELNIKFGSNFIKKGKVNPLSFKSYAFIFGNIARPVIIIAAPPRTNNNATYLLAMLTHPLITGVLKQILLCITIKLLPNFSCCKSKVLKVFTDKTSINESELAQL